MTSALLNLKNMSIYQLITTCIIAGFSVFAMFFGSGNLVFPLSLGKLSGGAYPLAIFGLFASGILIPLLGILGVYRHNGSLDSFFSKLGDKMGFLILLIMISLLGPFGVVPRCLTIAYSSIQNIAPGLPLWGFAVAFCGALFFVIRSEMSIVTFIGKVLTPVLLFALGIIIYSGLTVTHAPTFPFFLSPGESLLTGFTMGYQTMDLLAGFFFAVTIMNHMSAKVKKAPGTYALGEEKLSLWALCIGGTLLAILYGFMVYMGAVLADVLETTQPQNYFNAVAHYTLGESAGLVVSVAVILTCFTTALALMKIFVAFLQEKVGPFLRSFLSPREHAQRISFPFTLMGSCLVTFVISLFEFSGIIGFLAPILSVLYPALIAYCLCDLVAPNMKATPIRLIFFATMGMSAGLNFWAG